MPEPQLHANVRGLSPSATVAINERSNALIRKGKRVFKLGLGQSPFPVPQEVTAALRTNAHQRDYLPVQGLEALRRAVADHTQRTIGLSDRTAVDVMIGPGSKELMFLLQLVHDSELVLPSPSWVSYAPQARLLGRSVRTAETRREDGWMVTPEALDRACRAEGQRLILLNYPSNPTGQTFTASQLCELAEVARRHRALVLSDEIYGEIDHAGTHRSIAEWYPEGTIVSGGLSKWCGAGGWRLGTFVFPDTLHGLRSAMVTAASETFTSVSAPIQYAAIRAFEGAGDLKTYLAHSRQILGALGRRVAKSLQDAGAEVASPTGGFYLFPDFEPCRTRLAARGIDSAGTLCERLLEETGVAVLPGDDFGQPEGTLTVRLAYVDFDGGSALSAAQIAAENERAIDQGFVQENCPQVLEAIDRMCAWVSQ